MHAMDPHQFARSLLFAHFSLAKPCTECMYPRDKEYIFSFILAIRAPSARIKASGWISQLVMTGMARDLQGSDNDATSRL